MPQFNVGELKSKKIYNKTFDNFLGLDTYNNPINVNENRSPKMKNFIFRDGANRKRSGFVQKALFTDTKINGYWEFIDSVTSTKHCIVHAGTSIYKIVFGDTPNLNTKTLLSSGLTGILNQKSYGIVRNNVLYIFTGQNYLMYYDSTPATTHTWVLAEVTTNAYIPTTRIGISPINDTTTADEPLENVNMLQPYRYNTLIGSIGKVIKSYTDFGVDTEYAQFGGGYIGYKVDGFPCDANHIEIQINNTSVVSGVTHVSGLASGTFNITSVRKIYSYNSTNQPVTSDDQEVLDIMNLFNVESLPIGKLRLETFISGGKLFLDLKIAFVNLSHSCQLSILKNNEDIVGSYNGGDVYQLDAKSILSEGLVVTNTDTNTTLAISTDYTVDTSKGQITLLTNQRPLVEGQANIRVKFKTTSETTSIDKIKKCTFGVMFGYNEEQQLFVSGNPDYPNFDWHTSTRYKENTNDLSLLKEDDLTYFSDRDSHKIGSPTNMVSGYTLLNDNTLAIHKTESHHESNLWIRTSFLSTKLNSNGDEIVDANGNTYKGVSYSMVSSANGEACVSDKSCKNLNGDKLFLSKNGVFSVTLDSNIKSNERYATLRSKLINNQLLQENDLEKAVSIVFDGKYFLAIGNHIYIADSKYLYSDGDYEWWYWELEHSLVISTLFIKDDKLWFGTEDGRLCSFDGTGYKDAIYDEVTATLQDVQDRVDDETIYSSVNFGTYNKEFNYGLVIPNNLTDSLSTYYDDRYVFKIIAFGETLDSSHLTQLLVSNDYYNNILKYELDDEGKSKEPVYILSTVDGLFSDHSYDLYVDSENSNGDYIIELIDKESNEPHTFTLNEGVYIFNKLEGRIKAYVDNNQKVKLYNPSENGYISLYDPENTSVHLLAYIEKPVTAIWWTPIVDLGNPMYAKTINHITIVPNTYGDGEMYIGYLTKDNYVSSRTEGVDLFELSNFNLEFFSTDPSKFMRAFSKKLKIKKFNFIQFVIKSDSDRECSTNEFMINYFMTKKNKGVK